MARCTKCGACRAVCPVFLETGEEGHVARGLISLAEAVLEGRLSYSREVEELCRFCLGCLRCTESCASDVAYEAVLQAVRAGLAEERGVPRAARAMFSFVLPRRWLFGLTLRLARLLQRVLPFRRSGRIRHLPLLFMDRRQVPRLARRTALSKHRDSTRNRGERVGLFVGCLINYAYPRVAAAAINALERAGYDVVAPGEQVCCGSPVMAMGDVNAARILARRNLAAFKRAGVTRVATACAACGRTLRHAYAQVIPEEWRAAGIDVVDVSELIAPRLDRVAPESPAGVRATYHDPCLLKWGQGITEQPRRLLEPSVELVEMEDADRCCGNGGTSSVFHHDLSAKIADHKLAAIEKSGADAVVTGCPGCMLQFEDRLAAAGSSVRVLHTVEALLGRFDQIE